MQAVLHAVRHKASADFFVVRVDVAVAVLLLLLCHALPPGGNAHRFEAASPWLEVAPCITIRTLR